ncbi:MULTISPECIES: MFS transporter [unclassified Exiguobacterium]|uniref:MFS transporter n=1 Tax=unclassified Exiguobacterium TaxID=2644629 RepID=UPI00103FFC44|nr:MULTISPECIES: MFS transporter [unclassified Exiguobacterium]TCI43495.1 MFS transporter [Exiguobacterium sp. SH5S32]TCI52443.1 MFS transporter [Exiguobacterium sp. SH1S4]TCI68750.1 MFS transporter [Exiguobacterium sp. SH1S1]
MHTWKHPLLLLTGVGISNLGAWVYFIALNLIVLDMTQSPFAVSVLYILVPLAALCANFWSGTVIDRADTRRLMIMLDTLRAAVVFSLAFIDSLAIIYVLVFALNVANSIFESASLVYMTKLVSSGDRQRFNALKNFVQSAGFILGPAIAGILFMIGTPTLAIQLNAAALLISVGILSLLPTLFTPKDEVGVFSLRMIIEDWKTVVRFASTRRYVTLVYSLFCVMTIFMSGLDSLEASFATQVLDFSESRYGFLVSVAGAGIIAGSIINATFSARMTLPFLIGFGATMTPVGYLIFAFSESFVLAAIGFFLLTFALSFANTGFLSFYQNNVPTDLMGRFSGVINVAESILIIGLTFGIGLLAEYVGIRSTIVAFSLAFLLVGLVTVRVVLARSRRAMYEPVVIEENVA